MCSIEFKSVRQDSVRMDLYASLRCLLRSIKRLIYSNNTIVYNNTAVYYYDTAQNNDKRREMR